jgi:hypothetical protein
MAFSSEFLSLDDNNQKEEKDEEMPSSSSSVLPSRDIFDLYTSEGIYEDEYGEYSGCYIDDDDDPPSKVVEIEEPERRENFKFTIDESLLKNKLSKVLTDLKGSSGIKEKMDDKPSSSRSTSGSELVVSGRFSNIPNSHISTSIQLKVSRVFYS